MPAPLPERHPVVFWTSASIIGGLVLLAVMLMQSDWVVMVDGEPVPGLRAFFGSVQAWISERFGWLFISAVNLYLVVALYFLFSKHGRLKLGRPDEKPEFSYWSWLAMLFSAGMGIGLLFWSVAEPVMHLQSPPVGEGGTPAAAGQAMAVTMFHWGFHAWGIYGMVGLALAFFCFRRNLPLTVRSAFHPLLGDRIHGPLGNTVDILAVVATLFGVATSLGLGVQQIYAGLDHVLGVGGWAGP